MMAYGSYDQPVLTAETILNLLGKLSCNTVVTFYLQFCFARFCFVYIDEVFLACTRINFNVCTHSYVASYC